MHRRTHRNKIEKPYWLQLPISELLLRYDHRDRNRDSFIFVKQQGCFRYKTEKVNTTIDFSIFGLV